MMFNLDTKPLKNNTEIKTLFSGWNLFSFGKIRSVWILGLLFNPKFCGSKNCLRLTQNAWHFGQGYPWKYWRYRQYSSAPLADGLNQNFAIVEFRFKCPPSCVVSERILSRKKVFCWVQTSHPPLAKTVWLYRWERPSLFVHARLLKLFAEKSRT